MDYQLTVPAIGAVLHTLNLGLHANDLAYIIEHGGDRVIIVDSSQAGNGDAVRRSTRPYRRRPRPVGRGRWASSRCGHVDKDESPEPGTERGTERGTGTRTQKTEQGTK